MGEIVIKRWQCDRCGLVTDTAPPGKSRVKLVCEAEGDWAMDLAIAWREMCEPCRDAVVRIIRSMPAEKQP